MADEHFSYEAIERFFRSELSRGESREFVRHLLRQCPRCSGLIREIAHGRSFNFLVHGLETSPVSRFAASSGKQILDRVLRLVGRGGPRSARGKRAT